MMSEAATAAVCTVVALNASSTLRPTSPAPPAAAAAGRTQPSANCTTPLGIKSRCRRGSGAAAASTPLPSLSPGATLSRGCVSGPLLAGPTPGGGQVGAGKVHKGRDCIYGAFRLLGLLFQRLLQEAEVKHPGCAAGGAEGAGPVPQCHLVEVLHRVSSSMAQCLAAVADAELVAVVLDESWGMPLQQAVQLLSGTPSAQLQAQQEGKRQGDKALQQRKGQQHSGLKLPQADVTKHLLALWEEVLGCLVQLHAGGSNVQRWASKRLSYGTALLDLLTVLFAAALVGTSALQCQRRSGHG